MRKIRTAHWWQISLTLFIGVMITLGTFWLLQVMRQGGNGAAADPTSNEPDYYIHNFSFVKMDLTGKPSYLVSGVKLTHRPLDDSSEIDKPAMRSLSEGQQPLNIVAQRGRIDQNNTRVQLNDSVVIDRAANATRQSLNLKTEALTVYPDTENMETALPVEMLVGTTHITGVGMKGNNATGQVDIASRLHITYPVKPR